MMQQLLCDALRAEGKSRAAKRQADPAPAAPESPSLKGDTETDSGTNPQTDAPTTKGPWTKKKQTILARVAAARAKGVTLAQIAAASGGRINEGRVIDAINAAKLSVSEWKALENALNQIPEAANGAAAEA